jgi:hypothetical protein
MAPRLGVFVYSRAVSHREDDLGGRLAGSVARACLPALREVVLAALSHGGERAVRDGVERALDGVRPSLRPSDGVRDRAGMERLRAHLARLGLDGSGDLGLPWVVLHGYATLVLALASVRLVAAAGAEGDGEAGAARAAPEPPRRRGPGLVDTSRIESILEPAAGNWILASEHREVAGAVRFVDEVFEQTSSAGFPPDAELAGRLLEHLFPASARRSLGEFYTPRWLVEYALEVAGWTGSPEPASKLVDPTCGAGAFVAGAIRSLRARRTGAREARGECLAAILGSVGGFDVNPLSVMAARVAYLACVADLLEPGDAAPPMPIARRDILQEALDGATAARGAADVLVGNPPWVRWSDLAQRDRERAGQLARRYDLVPASAWHGGSELDLSAVVVTAACDLDLRRGGVACFLLPATHLHAPSSSAFRRFRLPDGTPLGLRHVVDFGGLRLFRGAANRTVLLAWAKGEPARFPVECTRFERRAGPMPSPAQGWEEAKQALRSTRAEAHVVGDDLRLALHEPGRGALARRLGRGCTWLRGRKGVMTDLNAAYFVRVLGPGSAPDRLEVVNDVSSRGHAVPVRRFEVERELVFPLLKGASQIEAFRARPCEAAVIVPNRSIGRAEDEAAFRSRCPAAYEHFERVERETGGALRRRSTWSKRLGPSGAPFFFVYDVGPYTFSPFKVVWAEMASSLRAAVISSAPLLEGEPERVIVPDHKVYFAAFELEQEADFVCALLNAPSVRRHVDGLTAKLQVGAIFHHLAIPRFEASNEAHASLAALGARARLADPEPGLLALVDEIARRML